MRPDRRSVLAAGAASALMVPASALSQVQPPLSLSGRFIQGGHILGRTAPGALILVDGEALTQASEHGLFFVGLDREAAASVEIAVETGTDRLVRQLQVAPGDFPSSRIDGLPPQTVTPTAPEVLERIAREAQLKTEAYASRAPGEGFAEGFIWPVEGFRISSRWGAQRILNGTPARPHFGIDLAVPAGTPIRAPASGVVVLAEPDLHFEGGTTFIDHGQGLISVYLHQSRLEVAVGDRVERGHRLGRVGATGRATGPHLCWRARWRDRNLDPSLMVESAAPPA